LRGLYASTRIVRAAASSVYCNNISVPLASPSYRWRWNGARGYTILAGPDLQWNFVRGPSISGWQRPLADFRRDADHQSVARRFLSSRRLCRDLGELDRLLVGTGHSARAILQHYAGLRHGARFAAAFGVGPAAASVADGRLRISVSAGRA